MVRYLVLLKFTDQGIRNVAESIDRAAAFREAARAKGAEVESHYWTLGAYDGVFILRAPDEATAAGLVLGLGHTASVSTNMLRAFDEAEFEDVLGFAS